jgi:ferritin-like metal-binding protein YciE
MQTLNELFEQTLKDVYYAEKAILKALPKVAKKASSKKLPAPSVSMKKKRRSRPNA